MKLRRLTYYMFVGLSGTVLIWVLAVVIREIREQPAFRIGMTSDEFIASATAQEKAVKNWLLPYRECVASSSGADQAGFETMYYFNRRHVFLTRRVNYEFTNRTLVNISPSYWLWSY